MNTTAQVAQLRKQLKTSTRAIEIGELARDISGLTTPGIATAEEVLRRDLITYGAYGILQFELSVANAEIERLTKLVNSR